MLASVALTQEEFMINLFEMTLKPRPKGFHLITEEIVANLKELPQTGLLHLFILHTSAALAINENADPTVRSDLNRAFDELAPENRSYYQHTAEGPDDMPSHIKAVLTGSSITIPITDHSLRLGTWQGIYLCEFREEASPRRLVMTVLS
jgi:secondary thiamine-phosphate synthase enzyme